MDLGYREELARQAAESLERSDHPDAHVAAAALRRLASAEEPPTPAERKELERQAKELARADVAELRAADRALRARCAELAPSTNPSAAAARVLRLAPSEPAVSVAPGARRRGCRRPPGLRARRRLPPRTPAWADRERETLLS